MTQTIAMIAGPYLFLTGLGFLLSTSFYEQMVAGNSTADPVLLNLSGAVHFLAGLIILVQHFHWSTAPQVTVSLLGTAALAKGAALIVIPELTLKSPKTSRTGLKLSAIGFLAVGGYLAYVGYVADSA